MSYNQMVYVPQAVLIEGLLPQSLRATDSSWDHQWFWDGHEHVDPAKEATAQATRLQNLTTTLATEYARVGLDWETELRQRAREKQLMEELGLVNEAPEETETAPTEEES